jgi:hypothetical protein
MDPPHFLLFDRYNKLFHNKSVFCTFSLTSIQYATTLQCETQIGHRGKEIKYIQIQVYVNTTSYTCVMWYKGQC